MEFGECALKRVKDQLFCETGSFGAMGRMGEFVHDPDEVGKAFEKAVFFFEIGG